MKRREILAISSLGGSALAGCLTSNEDNWGYERTCELPTFEYRHLPANAKEEVDIAFSEGRYKTDEKLYYERLLEEPEEQALRKDGSYYVSNITREEEDTIFGTTVASTLSFEETIPEFDSPQIIEIRNRTDSEITITVTIRYANGGVLTDENGNEIINREITLGNASSWNSNYQFEALDKYTTYVVNLEFESGRTESETFRFDRRSERLEVSIGENRFSGGGIGAGYSTCEWEPNEG